MIEANKNLNISERNEHAHIVVLDDGDTFGSIDGAYVIMNALLNNEDSKSEFDLDEFSKSYAISDLLKSHIIIESLQKKSYFSSISSQKYQEVLDRWNEFVFEIFRDWQDQMIDSDSECPSRNNPKFITYVDKKYSYEVFCDKSVENKALIDITRSGI